MAGRVSFLGAGPGAADLVTVRGARRLAEADVVVWASNLMDPACVREHARADVELVDYSRIDSDQLWEIYRRAAREHLRVVRLYAGDPAVWSAVGEQCDGCRRLGLHVEIVPGVSEFSATAAISGCELTDPEVAQSLVLARWEGGSAQVPDGDRIREFARHGTTMVVSVPAARVRQFVEQLRAGGYPDSTAVVVAYKMTCPDELILRSTVGELADTVREHKLWRHTLFLVGNALRPGGRTQRFGGAAGPVPGYRQGESTSPPGESTRVLPTPRSRAGEWPLQIRRSGWVAARVGPGTSADSVEQSAHVRGPASVAAWSAVRQWQETARSAGRPGTRGRPAGEAARSTAPKLPDQPTLALDAGLAVDVTEPTAKTTAAATQSAAARTPGATTSVKSGAKKPAARRGGNRRSAKPSQQSDPAATPRGDAGGAAAPKD